MPIRRYLHIFLIIAAFLGIGIMMSSHNHEFTSNRPPIYTILIMHILCISASLLLLRPWRKIGPVALRYFLLVLINFTVCFLTNFILGFDLSLPFIFRISMIISIVFTLAEQSELASFRKAENDRLASEKETAEQALLRQQLNPHFLFNSLNTLKGFIEEDQERAVEYLHEFSEVYRYVLSSRDKDLIPLEEELEILKAYYKLLHARFGSKLNLEIEVAQEVRQLAVPPLALQLLLENAIKHNEVSKARPLTFSLKSEGKYLIARNPLQKKRSFDENNGLGLSNLATRLHYTSGKKLSFGPTVDQTIFEVTIPLTKLNV